LTDNKLYTTVLRHKDIIHFEGFLKREQSIGDTKFHFIVIG